MSGVGGSGHETLPAHWTGFAGGLYTGAGERARLLGVSECWISSTKVSRLDNATETERPPLQRRHSLSDAIIMMDRSIVGLPSCPWGPVGLSDLCEATGGSFNSELGEMSPQFHQLGGQNCI